MNYQHVFLFLSVSLTSFRSTVPMENAQAETAIIETNPKRIRQHPINPQPCDLPKEMWFEIAQRCINHDGFSEQEIIGNLDALRAASVGIRNAIDEYAKRIGWQQTPRIEDYPYQQFRSNILRTRARAIIRANLFWAVLDVAEKYNSSFIVNTLYEDRSYVRMGIDQRMQQITYIYSSSNLKPYLHTSSEIKKNLMQLTLLPWAAKGKFYPLSDSVKPHIWLHDLFTRSWVRKITEARRSSMQALLDAGIDPNQTDRCGRTALMNILSDTYGHDKRTIKMLIKAGANLNIKDEFGNTALSLALYTQCSHAILRSLLKAKADPSIRNNQGLSPMNNPRVTCMMEKLDKESSPAPALCTIQ